MKLFHERQRRTRYPTYGTPVKGKVLYLAGAHFFAPLEPGDPIEPKTRELNIETLAAGGRGVARPVGGKVWLVAGAVPGDVVEAHLGREHRTWVSARAVRFITTSPDRREAPCPLQSECGGCPWMVLPDTVQQHWKSRLVADALTRMAGLDAATIEPIRASPRVLGWRNRVEFTIARADHGGMAIGLFRADGNGIVDVPLCLLQTDGANAVLATARRLLTKRGLVADSTSSARLILRASTRGDVLVVVREQRPVLRDLAGFARELRKREPSVVGVIKMSARPGWRGAVHYTTLAGEEWIEERIGGVSFRLPPATFVQVNADAAAGLLDAVVEFAGDVEGYDVLDLYGGVGAYGVALAGRGARVTVADADRDAVRCGKNAARRAGRRLSFVRSDVLRFLDRESAAARRPHLIVANPPRTGFGKQVGDAIARLVPSRLILVSCDPATLARDVKRLVAAGYRPTRVVPFDLFPQTAHVETVVVLERAAAHTPT